MFNDRKRAVLVVASLVVSTAVVVPTPRAGAAIRVTKAGPFRYVVASGSADEAAPARVQAICPTGFRATGGGGAISGKGRSRLTGIDLYDLPNVFPFFDSDTAPDDGYEAKAWNPSTARSVTSYAICYSDASALTYSHDGGTMSGSPNAVSASCGPKMMLGGGGESDASDDMFGLRGSAPSEALGSDGLQQWVFGFQTGDPSYVAAADAACLPAGVRKAYVARKRVSTRRDGTAVAKVMCRSGYHVSGGGVDQTGLIHSSRPVDGADADSAPDDGWAASMSLQAPHVTNAVYATCVR